MHGLLFQQQNGRVVRYGFVMCLQLNKIQKPFHLKSSPSGSSVGLAMVCSEGLVYTLCGCEHQCSLSMGLPRSRFCRSLPRDHKDRHMPIQPIVRAFEHFSRLQLLRNVTLLTNMVPRSGEADYVLANGH